MLGELVNSLPSTIDITQYLNMTGQEIDSKLGTMYQVPVDIAALPNSQGALLTSIHRKLASGRVIMAATISHADTAMHAYAVQLVKEAQMELMTLANGDIVLIGAERVDGSGDPRGDIEDAEVRDPLARVPASTQRDDYSAVKAFEDNFMKDDILRRPIVPWEPGSRA